MSDMREIKFRGYQEALGYFVYGDYLQVPKIDEGQVYNHWVVRDDGFKYVVENGETIGQFTGLKDRNGKEIYEGDILEFGLNEGVLRSVVTYRAPAFCHKWINLKEAGIRGKEIEPLFWNTHIIFEVIGNVFENPELLKNE